MGSHFIHWKLGLLKVELYKSSKAKKCQFRRSKLVFYLPNCLGIYLLDSRRDSLVITDSLVIKIDTTHNISGKLWSTPPPTKMKARHAPAKNNRSRIRLQPETPESLTQHLKPCYLPEKSRTNVISTTASAPIGTSPAAEMNKENIYIYIYVL